MNERTDVNPETLGLFRKLKEDTLHVHERWKYFRQLYADESGDRLALLSEAANDLFFIIMWLFLHDACVGVCRLTDPERSAGKDNLVFAGLVESVRQQFPSDPIVPALEDRLESARRQAEPLRQRRNQLIAHRDKRHALEPGVNPMPGLSRQAVEEALAAAADFLNEFELWYARSRTVYRFPLTQTDGRFLLHALERAHRYRLLEEQGQVEPAPFPDLRDLT